MINDEPVSVEVYKSFREKLNKKEIKEVKFEINREKEIFIHLGDVKEKKVDYFVEDDIAYITVSTFVMDSISEFKDAVDFAVKENVSKIVFDLRNNSGGDVDAVSAMLDYILGDGDGLFGRVGHRAGAEHRQQENERQQFLHRGNSFLVLKQLIRCFDRNHSCSSSMK